MKGILGVLALAVPLLLPAGPGIAEDAPSYLPVRGNEVVVYTHLFNPDDFEEGRKLVEDGFIKAMTDMGEKRRTYFLVDAPNHKVVVVSFFAEGVSVDEWQAFAGRLDVLEKLEPLRREPLKIERFSVDAVHNVD